MRSRVDFVPAGLAGLFAVTALALSWRGADWPGQLLRVELIESSGPAIWNNLWYSGHHGHWRLFRVVDAEPLVTGPGRLVRLDPTSVVLDVEEAAPVLVRVRWSSHFELDRPGCVRPSPDDWTIVHPDRPGRVTLRAVLAPTDGCEP